MDFLKATLVRSVTEGRSQSQRGGHRGETAMKSKLRGARAVVLPASLPLLSLVASSGASADILTGTFSGTASGTVAGNFGTGFVQPTQFTSIPFTATLTFNTALGFLSSPMPGSFLLQGGGIFGGTNPVLIATFSAPALQP